MFLTEFCTQSISSDTALIKLEDPIDKRWAYAGNYSGLIDFIEKGPAYIKAAIYLSHTNIENGMLVYFQKDKSYYSKRELRGSIFAVSKILS